MNMFSRKGFTLIELLIVIVIIGILATALIPKLKGIQARGRDTARIADMKQLQTALELYNNENNKYPGYGHFKSSLGSGCNTMTTPNMLSGMFDTYLQSYMTSLPVDPKGTDTHCYTYSRVDGSVHYCTKKDGTVIHIDGIDAGGNVTGPQGIYALTFVAETDLGDAYSLRNIQPGGNLKRYCVFPPGV